MTVQASNMMRFHVNDFESSNLHSVEKERLLKATGLSRNQNNKC